MKITKKQSAENRRHQACETLRVVYLTPGTKVYTVLTHVTRSGMSRSIKVLVNATAAHDGSTHLADITRIVATATNSSIDKRHEGIKMVGCGMDMGFHLVYELGATLWPHGTPEPHGRRNGEPDSTGGYALKQQWI